MKLHPRIVVSAFSLIAVSACSHPANGSSDVTPAREQKGDIVTPPKFSGGGMVAFNPTPTKPRGTVDVPIDSTGKPELVGIRFTGTFSEISRRDIVEWVGQASFTPAKRNGIPERGVFKLTIR